MRPLPDRPSVAEVLPLVERYMAVVGNGHSANYHIVLDDHNVKDKDVQWCLDRCREEGDTLGVEVGEQLLRLSKTQRLKLSGSV